MKAPRIKKFEISLLISLCITLCYGTYISAAAQSLSEGVVRLHVIAASDEASEQETKLIVRDAVVSYLSPVIESAQTAQQAQDLIEQSLDEIAEIARDSADGREVSVSFGMCAYGARQADGYSLPAGEYMSLRVTLGEGAGHNWWGVIFPELNPDAESYAPASTLGGKASSLIEEEEGVTIKFKTLEYLQKIKDFFS